jgi:YggT family protein
MIIIARTFWFIQSAVIAIIVALIALMVLRVIVDAADLNPFGWIHRTVRRLSDWIVAPVRGGLRGFGVDPKFAPLVAILIVILLGFFLLSLVSTIAITISGILLGLKTGAPIWILGYFLYGLLSIYSLMILVRIVFSWGGVSYVNRLMRFLVDITEPLLGPLRRIIPPLGMWDISPIVAFLIIWLFQQAIAGTLLRSAPFQTF